MNPISYLLIDPNKELTFENFIKNIGNDNFGVDYFFQKPLVSRVSENIEVKKDYSEELYNRAYVLSTVALAWLKENGIFNKVVFAYQLDVRYWEIHIVLSVFSIP